MIMAGGAVAAACDELASRVLGIGAKLLQAKREEVRLVAGEVVGPSGRIAVADVARTWYRRPQDLPSDVNARGTSNARFAIKTWIAAVVPRNGREHRRDALACNTSRCKAEIGQGDGIGP
jgi:CO/xanthine dehydrogenase Mo-binding subunit